MVGAYYKKTFKNDFFWLGSNDSTRYFCVGEGLDFYQRIGGHQVISQHIGEMLDFWEKLLIDSFDVKSAPIPASMRAPFMRLVGKFCTLSFLFHIVWTYYIIIFLTSRIAKI